MGALESVKKMRGLKARTEKASEDRALTQDANDEQEPAGESLVEPERNAPSQQRKGRSQGQAKFRMFGKEKKSKKKRRGEKKQKKKEKRKKEERCNR